MLNVLSRPQVEGLPRPKLFSGRAAVGQPLLQLRSPVDADKPWFDLDVPADLTYGDQIEIQYGTAADFAGATSVVTTLTAQQASYGTLDLAQSALSNATLYYFRARYIYNNSTAGREKYTSPWSLARSFTVATISVPVTPTAISAGATGASGGTFDLSVGTCGDFDFGQPDAGRNIVVGVGGVLIGSVPSKAWVITDKDIAAANYAGTELTSRIANTLTSNNGCALFSGVVAAGRSGRVAAACGGSSHLLVAAAAAYGLASGTPTNTDKTDTSFPADDFNIGSSFTMPTGGFALAFEYTDGGNAPTWKNSFAALSNVSSPTSATRRASLAMRTASGSAQAAFSRGNFNSTSGVVAAYA